MTKSKVLDFSKNSKWLNGPDFLKLSEKDWPQQNFENNIIEVHELKSDEFLNVAKEIKKSDIIPEVSRFSKWNRFLRSTAYVFKFVELFKNQHSLCNKNLELQHIKQAESLIFTTVQQECYNQEINIIKNIGKLPTTS